MSTADGDNESQPLLQDSSTTSEQNNVSQSSKTEASLNAVVRKSSIERLSEASLDWRDIGRKLKISDDDLDRIQSDTIGGHKEQVYQMLKKWKQQNGRNATNKRLGDALESGGRKDLQQWLEQEAEARSTVPTNQSAEARSTVPTNQSAEAEARSTVPTNQSDYTIEVGGEELQFIDMQKKKKTLNYIILVSCVILLMFALILTVFFVRRASTTADKNPATTITTPLTKSMGTTAELQTSKKYPYYVNIQDYADEPGRHNLILGSTRPGDILLYTSRQKMLGTLFEVQRYIFQYSKKPTETISGVLVRDKWDDDTGGYPELIAGGPGQGSVNVKITSQKSRGFDFSFSVYGRNT